MAEGFDYIVVGGGSAGCVLANRLSEDASARVLLVEAGARDWDPLIKVPLMAGFFLRHNLHNWSYETEPEPHMAGRRIPWPRGKVLGGSSAINGMVYIRGNRGDYDHWAQLGLRDWSYERVMQYFKRSENFLDGTSDFHGSGGELPVVRSSAPVPLYDDFINAGVQAGFPRNDDFNGANQEGFGRFHFTQRNGQRWSTARSFLDPARGRANLSILTGAHLLRVVIEKGVTKGVEVSVRGEKRFIQADKEVVLSCGAITSPTALMMSGVGAADDLRSHGLNVAADLPAVGKNLQDHVNTRIIQACESPDSLYDLRRIDRAVLNVIRAVLTRTGPATSFPLESGCFMRSRPDVEYPDLQVHFFPGVPVTSGSRIPFVKPPEGVHDGYGYAASMCQLRPESRGSISLRSSDPFAAPVIRANYLSAEADRECFRAGIRMMREVFKQKAFDHMRAREFAPGPDVISDADLDAYVAKTAGTVFHPVGTCRMGADPQSVLDEELRVRGVDGLRVADASVMPTLISGNTNAPTIMIAEKCADYMKRAAGMAKAA
jgi:choline dehydrogenase